MHQYFRVRFALEGIAELDELFLQELVVLDDAVMDQGQFAAAREMRVGVLFRRFAVGGPARMAYAHRKGRGLAGRLLEFSLEVVDLALGLEHLNPPRFGLGEGNAGAVVSAILQLVKALDKEGGSLGAADISYNSTHNIYKFKMMHAKRLRLQM